MKESIVYSCLMKEFVIYEGINSLQLFMKEFVIYEGIKVYSC